MPRRSGNERAEGLRATKVATPLGELQSSHRIGVAVSLAGSMRRMVAIRENGLRRRQTDDEHRGSAQITRTVRLRFCVCGYYELSVRTDESSANTRVLQYLRLMNWVKGHRWRRLSVATTGPAPNSQHTAWICIKEWLCGIGQNNPTSFAWPPCGRSHVGSPACGSTLAGPAEQKACILF